MLPFDSTILRIWSEQLRVLWSGHHPTSWRGLRFLDPEAHLPSFVQQCPLTMQSISWLRLLDWNCLSLPLPHHCFGQEPIAPATYIATFLVKIDQGIATVSALRRFLVAHPALVWALGFPLPANHWQSRFDPEVSLPTHRHLSDVLRELPNDQLQRLLDAQVTQLQSLLPDSFGQTISLDTKAILAWVKENNPKTYIKEGRFDSAQQPVGDSDCKLGCKRRHNLKLTTPTHEGKPASTVSRSVGEYYWGYASGAVVTKLPGWGEFVLAEMTQTFDKGDTTYFFPLMKQVERRLGFRPRYGALDAAYDAFYVYDHFHSPDHNGFAAVPFSEKGNKKVHRQFDPDGLPLCAAGLAMPLKFTYQDRTTAIIPYERAKHVCPLLFPQPNGQSCPVDHPQWPKGGCSTHLAATPGSRIRHQLDRDSVAYQAVYKQRTAVERIFSQAVALGIERPKLRNQQAIANQNTLIYLLINCRALQRVLTKLATANK